MASAYYVCVFAGGGGARVPVPCMHGARSPGSEITDSYEPPCGCWQLTPGPPEQQPMHQLTLGPGEGFHESTEHHFVMLTVFRSISN